MLYKLRELKTKLFSDLTTIPDLLNQKHLPSLDGLRGISVITVIAGHLFMSTPYSKYAEAGIGVSIFFVISGFLITTLLLKEKINNGNISLKNFYIRRSLRILPVAYLYLIVLKILSVIFSLKIKTYGFFVAGFYLMNFPLVYDWYHYHYWTLAIEEQFYFIFPFIMAFSFNRYITITIMMILMMPVINILGFNNVGVFYTNHVVHVITFIIIHLFGLGTVSILIGSITAILVFKRIIVIEKLRASYFLSFIVFLMAVAIRMQPIVSIAINVMTVLFAFLMAYVILLNLKGDNFFRRLLSNPWLVKIGILSYSLYIWQQIFTREQPWAHSFKYAGSPYLNTVMLFIVAYISYHFFEKRFLLLKDRFQSKNITKQRAI